MLYCWTLVILWRMKKCFGLVSQLLHSLYFYSKYFFSLQSLSENSIPANDLTTNVHLETNRLSYRSGKRFNFQNYVKYDLCTVRIFYIVLYFTSYFHMREQLKCNLSVKINTFLGNFSKKRSFLSNRCKLGETFVCCPFRLYFISYYFLF